MRDTFLIGLVVFALIAIPAKAAEREASFVPPEAETAITSTEEIVEPSPAPAAETQASAPTVDVAPTPAPVDLGKPVEAASLPPVEPETAGLLNETTGGLGASMWNDTPRALVDRLLPDIQLPTASPTLNGLARRLLLSTAALPVGDAEPKRSLVSVRIEKLLAMGAVMDAWQLAMLAKPDRIEEATMRRLMEAALMNPDTREYCDKLPEVMTNRNSESWQQCLIVCQIRAGDMKAAQLGVDILREQKTKDELFVWLANRVIAADSKPLPQQLTPLTPLGMAMLRQLNVPLPSRLYKEPDALLTAELLRAKTGEEGLRLVLAERAAARGIIDARQLATVYSEVKFKPEALEDVLHTSEAGMRLRALLYQALQQDAAQSKRAELIGKFMQSVDPLALAGSMGQLVAEIASAIPVNGDANIHSAVLTRLFALTGKPDLAMSWLKIARGAADNLPAVAAQLQTDWPILVLSGLITDSEYGQDLNKWLDVVTTNGNDPAERTRRQQAGNILSLFSAAGFAVSEGAWARVLDMTADSHRAVSPPPILLEKLRAAGMSNRRGEAALLGISLVAAGAGDTPIFVTADAVRALRQVGLNGDALALAREAAVGLTLSVLDKKSGKQKDEMPVSTTPESPTTEQ